MAAVNGGMGVSLKPKRISLTMLVKRTIVSLILLPIGLALIVIGGPLYAGFITLILGLAAWEYDRIMRTGGYKPASALVVGGAVLIALLRAVDGFESSGWVISLILLASLTYHLFKFERGESQAATNFGITVGGAFYLGWIGAYLISLRALPDGKWWVLVMLPAVWFADSGAYLVGSRFGRHKMTPRLSPKKSWEGYLGGILFSVVGTMLLVLLMQKWFTFGIMISPWSGAFIGLIMSVISPLGDLGESMFKRQVGVKDSGNLIPGHGGVFDRIDSWLWAGVIGYYTILWLL
jgi:phosphatidate cytidylyltransferase